MQTIDSASTVKALPLTRTNFKSEEDRHQHFAERLIVSLATTKGEKGEKGDQGADGSGGGVNVPYAIQTVVTDIVVDTGGTDEMDVTDSKILTNPFVLITKDESYTGPVPWHIIIKNADETYTLKFESAIADPNDYLLRVYETQIIAI